ncbi:MFS transporter [Sphingobacterium sp. LRF_L2]|uniref:MFS transporter n=1 Tax=Sphingobacterium sp. LRF_L2 TaxID=3369421 RepID=UPI003F6416BD
MLLASVGTFVEALDIAIINLTIPAIQQDFDIDYDTVQWLQTLYVLFFGGFLIIGGKLVDQIGRKKIFIWGSFIFLGSSLAAGLSETFTTLALFRALQGFGAAFLMPASLSIVTHTFQEPQERSRAIGVFSSFAAIGSGSGLSIGGLISTYWSWHWVFLINVPLLVLTIIAAYRYLPSDFKQEKKDQQDFVSGFLLVFGLLALTFAIHELIHWSTKPYLISSSFCIAFLLLTLFVKRLFTVQTPLIEPILFRNRYLVISNLSFFLLGALFIGFLFLISLMLQKDMGYSGASAGLLLVPFNLLSACVAKFIIPPLTKRVPTTKLGVIGMLFMFIGVSSLLVAVYTNHPLFVVLLGASCISGIGMTICFTSFSVLGLQQVPATHYGIASSLTSTTYFLGAGIGLSIVTLLGQLVPTAFAVGPISLIILLLYAGIGITILNYLVRTEKKRKAIHIVPTNTYTSNSEAQLRK